MKLTPKAQEYRARMGDIISQRKTSSSLKPKDIGCHGTSLLVKALPYIQPGNFFGLPFAHALLYGVVKDFWAALLPATIGESCSTSCLDLLTYSLQWMTSNQRGMICTQPYTLIGLTHEMTAYE